MDAPTQIADRLLAATDDAQRQQLLASVEDPSGVARELLERGRGALSTSAADALTAAELAAALTEGRDHGLAAVSHRLKGQALRLLGRHADAIEAFHSAAEHARLAEDPRLAAQVQIGAIDSLGWIGRLEAAVSLARRLEKEFRELGAELDAARVLVNVANLYFRRDHYALALTDYLKAGDIFRAAGDAASAARVDANAANTHLFLNHTTDALGLYDRARREFESAGMEQEAAMVDGNIGYLRYVSGRLAEALTAFARARSVFESRGQEIEAAKADLDSGDAYRALNLFPEALETYDRALGVFARLGVDYERSRCELGRASVLASMERYDEAAQALDAAEAIFRKHRNPVQRAHVRIIRSQLMHASGRADVGREEAARAAQTFSRHRLAGWAAEARMLTLGEDSLSPAASRRMHRIADTARRESRGWLECRAHLSLGRHYRRNGRVERALGHFRSAVEVLESARAQIAPEDMHVAFLRDKLDVYEDLVSVLLDRGQPSDVEEALQRVEQSRSRLLLERLHAAWMDNAQGSEPVGSAGRPDVGDLRARLEELRARLSLGYHQLHRLDDRDGERLVGPAQHADGVNLSEIEREYRSTLHQLELHDPQNAFSSLTAAVPTLKDLRLSLQADETLVEYFVSGGSIGAFVLDRSGLRAERSVASVADVRHAARRLRFHLQKAAPTDEQSDTCSSQMLARTDEVLSRLYDLLIRPIDHLLDREKLVIVPHGPLHGLPFHAFRDGRQDAVDRWEISYAPSAAVWHKGTENRTTRSFDSSLLLMGVPAMGIEHVSSEIAALERISPSAQTFCGDDATVEAFREHAEQHHMIHLATHALFREDNPLFSGIRFADGWLLARDLYGMRLKCELATLSACQTGVTMVDTGDELFGLVRGFLAAGARSVLASLWPADDRSTASLMTRLYGHIANGRSRSSALRSAQQELRLESPHPYHWAAFALIGQR